MLQLASLLKDEVLCRTYYQNNITSDSWCFTVLISGWCECTPLSYRMYRLQPAVSAPPARPAVWHRHSSACNSFVCLVEPRWEITLPLKCCSHSEYV